MSLDRLETLVALALDFARAYGRSLNAAQRDQFRWLIVASKCPRVRGAVARMNAAHRKSHLALIGRLQKLCNPNPADELARIEGATIAFLQYAKALDRPLLPMESNAWEEMQDDWPTRPIKVALLAKSEEQGAYYTDLFDQLGKLIEPDPAARLRFERNRLAVEAELHEGNFALNTPAFYGVSIRRMNAREAKERIALQARLCRDIAMIAQELSLVKNSQRPQAARMSKLAKTVRAISDGFWERFSKMQDIPDDQLARVKSMARCVTGVLTTMAWEMSSIRRSDNREIKRLLQAGAKMARLGDEFTASCTQEIPLEESAAEVAAATKIMRELMKELPS